MYNENIHISVVSPVYKAETIVSELVRQVSLHVSAITDHYEILLVHDGSPDHSWDEIEKQCLLNKKVRGLKLSRNFGQHAAITAGLQHAQGEWVVVMDCDLQDRPDEIPHLYRKALEGFDIVLAQRVNRQDTALKKLNSKLFYKLFSYLTETQQDPSVANFGIYKKEVIHALLSMKDQIRYFPTMIQWVGFEKTYLPVAHDHRAGGKSSYTFRKLFRLAVNNIIAFSDKPLRLTVKLGFLISLISFVIGLAYLISYLLGRIEVLGYASIIISIWFLSGITISIVGICGLYIGKMFEKVKDRPFYIIQKTIN